MQIGLSGTIVPSRINSNIVAFLCKYINSRDLLLNGEFLLYSPISSLNFKRSRLFFFEPHFWLLVSSRGSGGDGGLCKVLVSTYVVPSFAYEGAPLNAFAPPFLHASYIPAFEAFLFIKCSVKREYLKNFVCCSL